MNYTVLVRVFAFIAFFFILDHSMGSIKRSFGKQFKEPTNVTKIDTDIYCQKSRPIKTKHAIEIKQMQFIPDYIEVSLGDTIVFSNKDFVPHDVTEEIDKKWTSSVFGPGNSWEMIVEDDVDYFCSLHVVMRGKIRIK